MANWDVLVIGGGASGLSAAIATAGMGLSCLVIDRMGGGGELMNLGSLQDVDEAMTGPDMAAQLLENAVTAGVELEIGEASELEQESLGWRVVADQGVHAARAVILAVGLAPGTLGLGNEHTYEGRGLSHCAVCDGPLYRGLPVVVVGADRWAVHEARELNEFECKVTLVTQDAAEPPRADGFAVVSGHIISLDGSPALETVTVALGDDMEPQRLPAQAVFVQTGRRPALGFARNAPACDRNGRLVTDRNLQCNMPGLFVTGDARSNADRTIAGAIEDGRRAAAGVQAMLVALGKPAN